MRATTSAPGNHHTETTTSAQGNTVSGSSSVFGLNFLSNSQSSVTSPFTLTDSAFARFTQILEAHKDAVGIKIFSKAGGCAGNEYDIELKYKDEDKSSAQQVSDTLVPNLTQNIALMQHRYDNHTHQHTETVSDSGVSKAVQLSEEFQYIYSHKSEHAHKSISFYIPNASMMFLIGLEIDYTANDVMAQFVFKNKNFKSCGCGSSFRVV